MMSENVDQIYEIVNHVTDVEQYVIYIAIMSLLGHGEKPLLITSDVGRAYTLAIPLSFDRYEGHIDLLKITDFIEDQLKVSQKGKPVTMRGALRWNDTRTGRVHEFPLPMSWFWGMDT
jgi:hypothetical protein